MTFKEIVRAAKRQGWEVSDDRRHTVFVSSVTSRKVFTASTPSDQRALKNIVADLRGEGLVWPVPGKKPSGRR